MYIVVMAMTTSGTKVEFQPITMLPVIDCMS